MNFERCIINSINKFGQSCLLQINDSSHINFKAIIYNCKSAAFPSSDFINFNLHTSNNPFIIIADPKAVQHIAPDLFISINSKNFQILDSKKFFLADKFSFLSASLLPTKHC